jgi:hypothetical protein
LHDPPQTTGQQNQARNKQSKHNHHARRTCTSCSSIEAPGRVAPHATKQGGHVSLFLFFSSKGREEEEGGRKFFAYRIVCEFFSSFSSSLSFPPCNFFLSCRLFFRHSTMAAAVATAATATATATTDLVQVSKRYNRLLERLAATHDEHENAFLHGWHQAISALDRFEDVYIRSATQTAKKVITLVVPVRMMLLRLSDYTHTHSNPQKLAWNAYVGRLLLAHSQIPSPASKLDTETITTLYAFMLKAQKVGSKVFQPLADAQAQANDLLAGWKAMLVAIAAADAV